ncbi:Poly [ADP-ribose] polymerase 1, variant 3 [Trifolium repens]|nr:Poly [ADP-ribose] polymerase 1, variant 3 [Trifolium repens]
MPSCYCISFLCFSSHLPQNTHFCDKSSLIGVHKLGFDWELEAEKKKKEFFAGLLYLLESLRWDDQQKIRKYIESGGGGAAGTPKSNAASKSNASKNIEYGSHIKLELLVFNVKRERAFDINKMIISPQNPIQMKLSKS